MQIAGSVAVVTGAASGLGLATTKALVAAGASVVIVDLPTSDGKQVAEDLGVAFSPGDVTSEDDIAAALDTAQERGPLRIAVNCAGVPDAARVVGKHGPFPLATFRKVVEVTSSGRSTSSASLPSASARPTRSTASAGSSSTRPRSRRSTGRSARPRTRRPRAAWSA